MYSITVRELINILEQYDDDLQVVTVSDYGDRCHTMQTIFIEDGEETTATLEESAYSTSGYKCTYSGDGEEVLVLNGSDLCD